MRTKPDNTGPRKCTTCKAAKLGAWIHHIQLPSKPKEGTEYGVSCPRALYCASDTFSTDHLPTKQKGIGGGDLADNPDSRLVSSQYGVAD